MLEAIRHAFSFLPTPSPWHDKAPVRGELFGIERLEQHAQSLAAAQTVTASPPRVPTLQSRLKDNAAVLLRAYRAGASELEKGRSVVPAAEWLLDNYHLVEAQVREIRDALPPGYYRQLPKLSNGPFAGYPRVFGIAWAFVAHTDSHIDAIALRRFIAAYQRVTPLTIGELWAVAITLRIVLIENLRRLADQMTAGRAARADADGLARRVLVEGCGRSALEADIAARSVLPLSELFAAQLAKRLRDQDPVTTPILGWLEARLGRQGVSVDDVVLHAQQRQGASNVTVRNVITSLRLISDLDWTELFEDVSLVNRVLCANSTFALMDFPTRNLYRSAIERLARGATLSELEIADRAVGAARAATGIGHDAGRVECATDAGYHLIGDGLATFEASIGYRPTVAQQLSRFHLRLGIGGYLGATLLVTVLLLAISLWLPGVPALAATGGWPMLLALVVLIWLIPASEVAFALINRAIAWHFGAVILPGLALSAGVPRSLRTLIAVPTLLSGEPELRAQIEGLEVHHLSGAGGDLSFALLTDGVDADQEVMPGDAHLLAVAADAIALLNERHGPGPAGDRFLLLHRRRIFNAGEGVWMGWERKRGKLHELNRLLRGATDTSYVPVDGAPPRVPADVRYVITLDADTRLPRDAALRLIGKIAHPLNRPRFDPALQRVIGGYAVLQPRVTPSLPVGREGSLFQRIFSAPGGIDSYATAASDVYQDLFNEGSYVGKGIYDVDAFEAALSGRIADNTVLSHDLLEGMFARTGLASDIEVVEEFPARHDVAAKRQHRWTRGDWQLLGWIFGHHAGRDAVPAVGRMKMFDNLRRSVLPLCQLAALATSWLAPAPLNLHATLLVLAAISIPILLPGLLSLRPHHTAVRWRSHAAMRLADLRTAAMQILFTVAFLPDQAWSTGDAIVRTLTRLLRTRRHLLEWTTAAQSKRNPRLDLAGFYRRMLGGVLLTAVVAAITIGVAPSGWPLVAPFVLLWLAAPALALWASRATRAAPRLTLSEEEAGELRRIARRTWRYFEVFVTPADNMLPPDNVQESPRQVVANRTSPTNIGLYLLSAVAAHDFGWAGTTETVARLEATFDALRRLSRYRGHFFNWYGTQDLRALTPAYVSSVDSGNLAGHLIVLANACEGWARTPAAATEAPETRKGMQDSVTLAHEALGSLLQAGSEQGREVEALLNEIDDHLHGAQRMATLMPTLRRLADHATRLCADMRPAAGNDALGDLSFWLGALSRRAVEHERDGAALAAASPDVAVRLLALASEAREMAMSMDFSFLFNGERKLLSIGFAMDDNRLDTSCYDLLASEARLASLFAIAKGDVPTRHWFRLGRAATPLGNGSALISWSGSMFEYLMPSLVMRAPKGSLLEQTSWLVVERQRTYGRSLSIPWGISESAYNARDLEFTYQYSNFGVPGLGLKRGLAENVVIAPYAAALAAMVDPPEALRNFRDLMRIGALARYGFYEAIDFTRSRLPENQDHAIVRAFMAHHQGMSIVALANTLLHGVMRERFHQEPMVQATELLLQERIPRNVAIAPPRAEDVKASAIAPTVQDSTARRMPGAVVGPPVTHLLSNGRYTVMLTAAGAGYSHWRDLSVTRWREDATCDEDGSFIFLRDNEDGRVWCAGAWIPGSDDVGEDNEVLFVEDRAAFHRRDGALTTTLDVLVSGEDDGEVRRASLSNSGRRTREITLTSYAGLALSAQAADVAHPAFSRLFIQTEYLAEFGALIATRRPRSQTDPQIWAAHFAVVEGDVCADPEYESDRARFLGRGRTIMTARAVQDGGPLSNTTGTVLDPIFSLRQQVRIAPGGVARVAFWTVVAASRAELLDLIDKHHDRSAFDRARTLAWTQAQVQLRHLDIKSNEAADFQRLAAAILYADRRLRAPSGAIARGAGLQSGLWPHAISGDLPIVLLRIDEIDDIAQVRQLLRAHEYWRMKRLGVDLVIVNEHASSYVQDLQVAIDTAVRSSQSRPRLGEEFAQGAVYALRADLMTGEARALLQSVARVALIARRGAIADQLARVPDPAWAPPPTLPLTPPPSRWPPAVASTSYDQASLEFFNGLGGFARDGREYVVILEDGSTTPAPWINVIANDGFGFQVSTEGSGYTWSVNSRENQLTPWSNDAVSDPAGEAIYVRDLASGEVWTATAQPVRDGGKYIACHGFGYSRFSHVAHGIGLELLQYVPVDDPVKISRMTLRNLSGEHRQLSVTAYVDWVLGLSRGASGPYIVTEFDAESGAMLARNPWNLAFPGRVAFACLVGTTTSWTADRSEFIGYRGTLGRPAALVAPAGSASLSGAAGAGMDPCAALQCHVSLAPGESTEVVVLLGQCAGADEARDLIARYRAGNLDSTLAAVTAQWTDLLGALQVKTPDRAMDIMLNGWLLYQTLACRVRARSAFYQASGAYGFRDQLQDTMALTFARPAETRRHLLRAAARQFEPGDVQHWWLPHSGQGVRTRISDDCVWLAFATATYVMGADDAAVLDEHIPFLDGPALAAGDHDLFFQPMVAEASASLFEHCARGIDRCIGLTGEHGLPLIGGGDWNDGMNLVGAGGKGESVWLGWLLARTIALFAPLADARDADRAARWRAHGLALREALEQHGWDGAWYRRATYDNGTPLGSKDSEACRIDAIAQSWSVLSGVGDPARSAMAMASLDQRLVRRDEGLALLFSPPFDGGVDDPGYLRAYPPGVRENGGQYSHAAMWSVLAFAELGDADTAVELFSMLNPIHHALTPQATDRYKVEPYVVAADVYSVAPHVGRGGWTWYTGAAGWMVRAGVEGILGIRREGAWLLIAPRIPASWPGFQATIALGAGRYDIRVERMGANDAVSAAMLDDLPIPCVNGAVRVQLEDGEHRLVLRLGDVQLRTAPSSNLANTRA